MKVIHQHVAVVKQIYSTTRPDYLPVIYEIEVEDESIDTITEESAKFIHRELGKLLYPEEGGAS
jgi:hypothetical protein